MTPQQKATKSTDQQHEPQKVQGFPRTEEVVSSKSLLENPHPAEPHPAKVPLAEHKASEADMRSTTGESHSTAESWGDGLEEGAVEASTSDLEDGEEKGNLNSKWSSTASAQATVSPAAF